MPVTLKDVAGNARNFLLEFYPGLKDIRLEEVKPSGEGWTVTFSFPNPDSFLPGNRIYKDVVVDNLGNPTEFTIRTV